MKVKAQSIHYTVSNICMCSLGCPSVSAFNILCLLCWVAYGDAHEYGVGRLHAVLILAQLLILYSAHKHTLHAQIGIRHIHRDVLLFPFN